MGTSVATTGMGTILYRGDGGVGAGVQANKTIGTVNQQLKILARIAGAAGNAKTFGIVVAGLTTSYSQVITSSSVLINSATDGAGAATTTVNEALYQLMQSSVFVDNFQGTRSSGNGTGLLVAGASGALSGGADGAEIFTAMSEVIDIDGPGEKADLTEVTHMTSPSNYREYLPTLVDGAEVSFMINWINDTQQAGVRTDLRNRIKRNWRITYPTAAGNVTENFSGYVTKVGMGFKKDSAISGSVSIKITGPITES